MGQSSQFSHSSPWALDTERPTQFLCDGDNKPLSNTAGTSRRQERDEEERRGLKTGHYKGALRRGGRRDGQGRSRGRSRGGGRRRGVRRGEGRDVRGKRRGG